MRSPKDLYAFLDQYVVGQEEAKKAVALTVFNHCARTEMQAKSNIKCNLRQNLLIVGPTGCGKTHIMNTLKEHMSYPVYMVSATDLSKPGWVGMSMNDFLVECFEHCKSNYDYYQFAFEHAIIFIDEIDKICIPAISSGGTDHNQGIQHSLLKIIDGAEVLLDVGDRKAIYQNVNTKNMLFILGGNFESVRKKLNDQSNSNTIGFITEKKGKLDLNMIHKELIATGMEKELAGRIANFVEVKKLDRNTLKKALLNRADGVLLQYEKLYYSYTYKKLRLSNYYINKILDITEASDIGARGLAAATEVVLRDKFYNIESKYTIDILKDESID